MYSEKIGEKPIYVQITTSRIVYLRYDNDTSKWVFSNRLKEGTIYASTTLNTTETYPYKLKVDWTLHNDNSNVNIDFQDAGNDIVSHMLNIQRRKNVIALM